MQKRQLVAVDTNILLLLADEDDLIRDAISLIQQRMVSSQLVASRTVLGELNFKAKFDSDNGLRKLAEKALSGIRSKYKITPEPLDGIQKAIAKEAAAKLLHSSLLPFSEQNDALIVAEAAILDCVLLVSNDSHLLEIDARRLALLFREMDLPAPIIVSPRDLMEKFYR